ncbi:MAG TPA: S28 family serine protease [Polyangia bacterium]|jgi:hypothetical protein
MRVYLRGAGWATLLVLAAALAACGRAPAVGVDAGPGDAPALDSARADAPPADAAFADVAPDAPLPDIAERLAAIPGMTVVEAGSTLPTYRFFRLTYDQPADHDAPDGTRFAQRLTLLHRSTAAPMVLASTGYMLWPAPYDASLAEPAQMLLANQVTVEHRFFTPSRPAPADWSRLTIAQAAADHHRIVTALKPLYGAAWISTGASKGGMTTVYHRRFYPDDVDGSVAYVAPLSFGLADARYVAFLAAVGDPACRAALTAFQRTALGRRAEIVAHMNAMATGGTTFDVLGVDVAFEHAVLELPFFFWQYHDVSLCTAIPVPTASAAQVWSFLDQVSDVTGFGDASVTDFEPYYYQAGTQLGYQGLDEAPVADLLAHPGTDRPETYCPGLGVTFDPAAMTDVDAWVRTAGARLMFVYGGNDPWSAAPFELGAAVDSFRYVVPAGNHGADIAQLPAAARLEATATLGRWAGVQAHLRAAGPRAGEPPLRVRRRLR